MHGFLVVYLYIFKFMITFAKVILYSTCGALKVMVEKKNIQCNDELLQRIANHAGSLMNV